MTCRRRSISLLMAALSVNTGIALIPARADAPTDVGQAPAPAAKPQMSSSKPAAGPTTKPAPKAANAPTTAKTAKTAKDLSADEMLSQMLKAPQATGNRPLAPLPTPSGGAPDRTSGAGAVAPSSPVVNLLREGTFLVDRTGRLSRSADGSQAEFSFEADGTAMQDPPVVIVPNLKLMQMEDAVANNPRDLRFRVSGSVTEYRGRNYILLEKVVVVPEILDKF